MNHREPSRTRFRVRPSSRLLALLLLPVLVPELAEATPRPRPSTGLPVRVQPEDPEPYLRHVEPVPLRFRPAPAPLAPWPETLTSADESAAPNSVTTDPVTTDVVASVQHSAPAGYTEGNPTEVVHSDVVAAAEPISNSPPDTPVRTPAPILVDELRPTVRPEDFLPFFILPGTQGQEGGPAVIVPIPRQPSSPAPLPPSSATYIRSP